MCSVWIPVFPLRYGHRNLYFLFYFFTLFILLTPSKLHSRVILTSLWSSPRLISTGRLKASQPLHPRPIYLVVSQVPYSLPRMGYLILGQASHLDAFSAYPSRTWLPSCALGRTTGTPSVRPSRSSRTRDSTPQVSYARSG